MVARTTIARQTERRQVVAAHLLLSDTDRPRNVSTLVVWWLSATAIANPNYENSPLGLAFNSIAEPGAQTLADLCSIVYSRVVLTLTTYAVHVVRSF